MGSVVDCPRCHQSVVVPPQSAPQAEQLYHILKNKQSEETTILPPKVHAEPEPNEPESAWDELGGDVNDADLNQWISDLWKTSPEIPNEPSSIIYSVPISNPHFGEEMTLVTLRKRYKLVMTLIYVVSPIAFFVGVVFCIFIQALFLQPSLPHKRLAGEAASVNEVIGKLYYLDQNGHRQPDVDAVIICLPKDRAPSPLLSCQGLLPEGAVNNETVQLIQEWGGLYERADANGFFTLHYKEGTRYLVVLVSANQVRAGGVLKPGVLQELRGYFHDPDLFSQTCLSTDEYEWSGGKWSLRHTFEATE